LQVMSFTSETLLPPHIANSKNSAAEGMLNTVPEAALYSATSAAGDSSQ
jgi:hypothetical protein